jgi:hypothetical protein
MQIFIKCLYVKNLWSKGGAGMRYRKKCRPEKIEMERFFKSLIWIVLLSVMSQEPTEAQFFSLRTYEPPKITDVRVIANPGIRAQWQGYFQKYWWKEGRISGQIIRDIMIGELNLPGEG